MTEPKRKRRLPKTTGKWRALRDDQVLVKVFGKRGQKALKREAQKASKPRQSNRLAS